jgi:hypothetical protein
MRGKQSMSKTAKMNRWLRKIVLFPLAILMGVDGGDPPTPPVDPPVDPPTPPADPPTPPADDLATLFTPEEVTAKKEAVTTAKAEETRRAALTDDERTAEDATKAEEAKANEVPEEYAAFTAPEGMEPEQTFLDIALPEFKELGLTQAKAQQLVDMFSTKLGPAIVQKQQEAWAAEVEGWKQAATKDPEIGGTKFDKSVEDALRAVNTINPALKPVFDQYGLGNHPEFIRAFAKIAPLLTEDTIDRIKGESSQPKSLAERMYPGLPK